MAETIVSPGVLTRENDLSQITEGPIVAGAAIVGPTVKGPVEEPILVTSYSDYKNKFGTSFISSSKQYTFFTSIAAHNYFQQGGESLLVTRVVSGSYASAISTQIQNGAISGTINLGQDSLLNSITQQPSASGGSDTTIITCSVGGEISASITLTAGTTNVSSITVVSGSATLGFGLGTTIVFSSHSLGATVGETTPGKDLIITFKPDDLITTASFELKTLSKGINENSTITSGAYHDLPGPNYSNKEIAGGILDSGSSDNLRWEINGVNTGSGIFNLLIRRGNDSRGEKVILEQFLNLSLDPFSPNYIESVIGNQRNTVVTDGDGGKYLKVEGEYPNRSRYVYVSAVNKKTPNYLNANGAISDGDYTASLPMSKLIHPSASSAISGAFAQATGQLGFTNVGGGAYYEQAISADNIQGLPATAYNDALSILSNTDLYNYNLIAFPGITSQMGGNATTVINTAITNAQERGDHLVIFDTSNYGNNSATAVAGRTDGFNTSYATTYWPWCNVVDPDTGQRPFVPASAMVLGAYAFNDNLGETWTAPAGINRGTLDNVIRTEKTLTKAERDTLYEARVNPLATFAGTGVTIFGQKTLQKKSSALDRVNVRRLLITLKQVIGDIGRTLVFENNTVATRNSFTTQATAFLESVQQRQGLFAFKVVMDESNNTPDTIDRNQLVGQVFIQPAKSAEFVILDFTLLPTGAEFPS
jgi:hypothetical protein